MSKLLNGLKKVFRIEGFINEKVDLAKKEILYVNRKEYLAHMASSSNEPGVSDQKYGSEEVVFSMASHGLRIYEAYLAIESIMQQSMKPNRFFLCLAKEEEGKPLPMLIQKQQRRGLEVKYVEDIWSFKKIVPALCECPDAIIITGDDDCLYNVDFIENLMRSHATDPKAIFGNRIHEITFNEDGSLKSYNDWNQHVGNTDRASNRFLITSVGGVLYPPHSLYKDATRSDIFMDIAKYNDDVWCFAMALLQGTPIRRARTHSEWGEDYYSLEEVQKYGLKIDNTNRTNCRNDQIIKAVFDRYDIYKYLK